MDQELDELIQLDQESTSAVEAKGMRMNRKRVPR